MSRTKIIATIGPASQKIDTLRELVEGGMDIARLNMSHGSYPEHRRIIRNLRQIEKNLKRPLGILLDLQGPKIRTGSLKQKKIILKAGQRFTITTEKIQGTPRIVSTNYPNFAAEVKAGERVLLDNGLLELAVDQVKGKEVICRVVTGGILGEKKGINLPDSKITAPPLTEKDEHDLAFGLKEKVDWVALSFVRKASDIITLKRWLQKRGVILPVIAKLETPEAIDQLDEIIDTADGIMVARGDLGVEMEPESVPLIQKRIIRACNQKGRPVITATQMLESMVENPRPTRAEASDVANAVFDGTDALMLSEETATGEYPVEAVETMTKIAATTEKVAYRENHVERVLTRHTASAAVAHASCQIALELNARAIITFTSSGSTALLVSKHRPACPIFAPTISLEILRRVSLYWGVIPLKIDRFGHTEDMILKTEQAILAAALLQRGDLVVITAGVPVGIPGTTNLIKVHRIGEAKDI